MKSQRETRPLNSVKSLPILQKSRSSIATIKASDFPSKTPQKSWESVILPFMSEDNVDNKDDNDIRLIDTTSLVSSKVSLDQLERSQSVISLKLNTAQNYIDQLELENQSLSYRVQSLLNHQKDDDVDIANDLGDLLNTNISKIQTLQQRLQSIVQVCKKLDGERNEYLLKLTTQNKLVNQLKLKLEQSEMLKTEYLHFKTKHEDSHNDLVIRSSMLEDKLRQSKEKLILNENQRNLLNQETVELKVFQQEISDYSQQYFTCNNRILDELDTLSTICTLSVPNISTEPTLNVLLNLQNGLKMMNYQSELIKLVEKWHSQMDLLTCHLNDTTKQNNNLQTLNLGLTGNYTTLLARLEDLTNVHQDINILRTHYEGLICNLTEPYIKQVLELQNTLKSNESRLQLELKQEKEVNLNYNVLIKRMGDYQTEKTIEIDARERLLIEKEKDLEERERLVAEQTNAIKRGVVRLNRKFKELQLESIEVAELSDCLPNLPTNTSKSTLLSQVQHIRTRFQRS